MSWNLEKVRKKRLTPQQMDDLGFERRSIYMNDFKKLLKENDRLIVFSDDRFNHYYFYDQVDRIMYKANWDQWGRVNYSIMNPDLFNRRELIYNTSKHKPYDLFFYRIYGVAVEFFKEDGTLKYGLEYQMKKIVEHNDRKLAKKQHA